MPVAETTLPRSALDVRVAYARLSDADLVDRAKEGDRSALEALIERHSARVSRLATHLLGDIEDARDAAQESFLKLTERLRQFRGECQFSTWLHRLVINTCRDVADRQRVRRTETLDPDRDAGFDPDGDPSRLALLSDLRREARLGARAAHGRAAARPAPARHPRSELRGDREALADPGRDREVARPPGEGQPQAPPPGVHAGVTPLGREEIEAIIPHREPFLLLDEVIELDPGARVVARKQVRADEWYLAGHFPGNPIMPGVLMVEALAQTGAVAVLSEEGNRGKLVLFAGIDDVRFKRLVRPGDVLELTCQLERVRGPVGRGAVRATVEGELAVRGTLTFAVADPPAGGS